MTEEIGSDAHKRPTSAEIDVAIVKERIREAVRRDEYIIAMLNSIRDEQTRQGTLLALGTQNFQMLQDKQAESNARIAVLENDKRSPTALTLGILSGLGTAATAVWVAVKGGSQP